MTTFRRYCLLFVVWLTAASTLLAGFPRVGCSCPRQERQDEPATESTPVCCCCGSCHASSGEGCCSSCPPTSEPSENGDAAPKHPSSQLTAPPCRQVVAQIALTLTVKVDNDQRELALAALTVESPAAVMPPFPHDPQRHEAPWRPPRDLVTLLRHLLI